MRLLRIQMRLAYEILGVSLEALADKSGLLLSHVQDFAEQENWKQWFKDFDIDADLANNDTNEDFSLDDALNAQLERYSEYAKAKLKIYNVAKELALADVYFEIECKILEKTLDTINNADMLGATDIKNYSSIYNEMAKRLQSISSVTLTKDENGLPSVVIKDLSGF
jgi:hypothetical protein